MKRFKTVEEFLEAEQLWKDELIELREIINETELVETVKWGMPVYTIDGKNVVGIGSFKSYFGIWFYQGVFLKDKAEKLINAQEGKTKAMRQWRFTSIDAIDKSLILKYLEEAIQNQKEGKEVKPEKKPLIIPNELSEALASNSALSEAFEKFSLSFKREYAEYISEAKKEETRTRRLEKIVPMILENTGLNDKYR